MPKNNFKRKQSQETPVREIQKAATGVNGLDDITHGGFPLGRSTLVFGAAGCGKTVLAMQFVYHGIRQFGEPGVFVTFEESREKLIDNMKSLGMELEPLIRQKKLYIEQINISPATFAETGEFTLDGLFVRIEAAIKRVGAKRIALDTIETLFGGLRNERILRGELKRLFTWLESAGLTAVITGERGDRTLTRHNLEEYVADCVIFLDHRVLDQISTRRLRIMKYRGTEHATDEFPFLIDHHGFTVLPVTSLKLVHKASREVISTGIDGLDAMFSLGGLFRGSSILISGTAGTGKTTMAATFASAACARGERALYFAFEESEDQLIRNMHSIGLRLEKCVRAQKLRYEAVRPTVNGLEAHLFKMQRLVDEFDPDVVIVDPITNFLSIGTTDDVKAMLMRLIDYLKSQQITTLFTSLTEGGAALEKTDIGVSSLIDTWLLLRDIEYSGERNRGIYVLKSRGSAHSNQIREFLITNHGVELVQVEVGPDGVLIGSARVRKLAEDREREKHRTFQKQRRERVLAQKLKTLEAQISLLRATCDGGEEEASRFLEREDNNRRRRVDQAELTYRGTLHRRSGKA